VVVDDLAGQMERDGEEVRPSQARVWPQSRAASAASWSLLHRAVSRTVNSVPVIACQAAARVLGLSAMSKRVPVVAGLYVEVVGLVGAEPVDKVVDVPARVGQAVELGARGNEGIGVVPLVLGLGGQARGRNGPDGSNEFALVTGDDVHEADLLILGVGEIKVGQGGRCGEAQLPVGQAKWKGRRSHRRAAPEATRNSAAEVG
jgi:hypothetical protein